jgi:hypothetical protein
MSVNASRGGTNETDADEAAHFDGMDETNVASVMCVRFTVDELLNGVAEALARALMAPQLEAAPILETLKEVRSWLRSMPALGLLFTMRENFRKFSRMISNRRWFRLLALNVAVTRLIGSLQQNPVIDLERRHLIVLFACVACSKLESAGIKMSSMPAMEQLAHQFSIADRARLAEMLPLNSAPEQLEPLFDTKRIKSALFIYNYDVSLWLLRACEVAGLPGAQTLPKLNMFETHDDSLDDGSAAQDRKATFVILLRETLFAMPFEGNNFALIEASIPQQKANAPTQRSVVAYFNARAREFCDAMHEREHALSLIDTLCFDPRFAYSETLAEAAADLQTHVLDDDYKPRFLERMVQEGVPQVYRATFGAVNAQPDARTPIVNNIDRLPLPKIPGNWLSARPRTHSSTWLCTAPLSALPQVSQVDCESSLYVIEEEEEDDADASWHTANVIGKRARFALEEAMRRNAAVISLD